MKLTFVVAILFATLSLAIGGEMVKYQSGSDQVQGYLAKPSGNGPFPGIVVIPEWWGLNDQIKKTADRLAVAGYEALAVDIYRGKVATDSDQAHQLMMALPEERGVQDVKAAFVYLQSQPNVKKNKIASIGWCMGGGYSFKLGTVEPQLAGCIIYYGRTSTDPETLKKITASVIGFFGETDTELTAAGKAFAEKAKSLGKKVEIHVYPGAGHAFANETGKNYKADAAKDAWDKTLAFLKQNLS